MPSPPDYSLRKSHRCGTHIGRIQHLPYQTCQFPFSECVVDPIAVMRTCDLSEIFYIFEIFEIFEVLRFWGSEVSRFLRFRGFEVLRFRGFEVSRFRDFEVLRFPDFEVSRFRGFEVLIVACLLSLIFLVGNYVYKVLPHKQMHSWLHSHNRKHVCLIHTWHLYAPMLGWVRSVRVVYAGPDEKAVHGEECRATRPHAKMGQRRPRFDKLSHMDGLWLVFIRQWSMFRCGWRAVSETRTNTIQDMIWITHTYVMLI